jgi:hypothetical protein
MNKKELDELRKRWEGDSGQRKDFDWYYWAGELLEEVERLKLLVTLDPERLSEQYVLSLETHLKAAKEVCEAARAEYEPFDDASFYRWQKNLAVALAKEAEVCARIKEKEGD